MTFKRCTMILREPHERGLGLGLRPFLCNDLAASCARSTKFRGLACLGVQGEGVLLAGVNLLGEGPWFNCSLSATSCAIKSLSETLPSVPLLSLETT